MIAIDKWFFRPQPRPDAARRLFCFAHAGSGASAFRLWPAGLPADVDLWALRLPGRENRLGEAPYANWPALVAGALPVLRAQLDRPFAFFGHSLGALLAYEFSHQLRDAGARLPDHIFVSSLRAPQRPNTRKDLHALPTAEFKAELADMNGVPAAVLASQELMELLLPTLRADMTLAETYPYRPRRLLDIPITAGHGARDHIVTADEMAAWSELTRAAFELAIFAGDHFYWQPDPSDLLQVIARRWPAG